jgi:hypothetical protein
MAIEWARAEGGGGGGGGGGVLNVIAYFGCCRICKFQTELRNIFRISNSKYTNM